MSRVDHAPECATMNPGDKFNPSIEPCTCDALERANAVLAAARPLLDQMVDLVGAWHRMPDMPRHHSELGVTLKTNCGVIYAIADALKPHTKEGK